ncbi:siderophore ABC transporter substrate-binding protein [Microbacterium thalli]|uniref:ABC transporter substrate-binding protein n=1 Tax=Microbacterium thalli TaxID=3027921 RepID=A0ABT5SI26_9MICO|nr:ABC transporter substrate-binding protein [Microbacterium thalli]MDD7928933.1 ABC transporter substrate-binding protein [Microbacterium thalli]MDD7961518.1 ABC transporter substrate-binding protein [Microbacterium thalli]
MTHSFARTRRPALVSIALVAALGLAGCASNASPAAEQTTPAPTTVTVTDNHGEIEVPVAPERVVALDNTTFQTLSDWDIDLVAAPKPLMYDLWPNLSGGEDVLDVGLHREPDLEAVIAAQPDLIVGGYRFRDIYDDLTAIQPATIETSPRDGEEQIAELKRQVEILGQVFDREEDAAALADALDQAVADAKGAYNGTDTVVGLITSGGKIAFAAPGEGRGVGAVFPTLGLVPGIDRGAENASHGDDISVEAIAAANPEWLIVLDRDAMFGEDGYVAAKELVEGSEALKNVPAVQKGQVVYLDPSFYLDEGIQAYTQLYSDIATAFAAAE